MAIDLSEFSDAIKRPGSVCTIHKLLAELPKDLHDKLVAALDAAHIPNTVVARVVKGWGYALHVDSVRRHRNGECRCG